MNSIVTKHYILILFYLIYFINLNGCNSKQSDYKFIINKSYELFQKLNLANLNNQEHSQFKLKCNFNLGYNYITINSNNTTIRNDNDQLNNYYQIKWFKLDPYNLLILKDFSFINENEMNKENVHISEIVDKENEIKLESSLEFSFKNGNDLNQANGIYLCKLDLKLNKNTSNSASLHILNNKPIFYQFVQEISFNEISQNQTENNYLSATLIQTTTNRLLIELDLKKVIKINENQTSSKLVYTLLKTNNQVPIAKGKIKTINNNQLKKELFLFEGLNPFTNYTLIIYSSNLNSKKYNLIYNETFSTLKSSQINLKKKSTQLDYAYDYEDEDEFYDYEAINEEDEHDELDDSFPKRVINCDLTKKEMESQDQSSKNSNNESLFTKINKNKIKSLIITINYSPNTLNRLLNTLNKNNETDDFTKLNLNNNDENFFNFFELIKFNRLNTNDFAINFDCLKQFKQTKSSKPLCMFNIEPRNEENIEDFDEYDTITNNNINDQFSVQSSIQLDNSAIIYISSTCRKANRPMRNSNSRSIDLIKTRAPRLFNNLTQSSPTPLFTKPSTLFIMTKNLFVSQSTNQPLNSLDQKQLSSYKKNTVNTIIPSYISKQFANINNCIIINNKEIQFQIESTKVSDSIHLNGKISPQINRIQYMNQSIPYYYYIEIEQSDNGNNNQLKNKYRTLTGQTSLNTYKFKFKIQNHTQVVRVNITTNLTFNEQISLNQTNSSTTTITTTKSNLNFKKDQDQLYQEDYFSLRNRQNNFIISNDDILIDNKNLIDNQNSSLLILSSVSERLISSLNDYYVFKIKILSEDNTHLTEFDLNVSCKKMNTTNTNSNSNITVQNQNDASSTFFGLLMTIICAIIIVIVGFLFCLIVKRKYGLSAPEYLLNFKNNFFLKTSNSNLANDQELAKKSRTFTYQHQFQQYQLETKTSSANMMISTNLQPSVFNQNKNPTFNYNYVRLLKQKWHNTSNMKNRKNTSRYYNTKSYSISSSSKIKLDESSNLLKRIRNLLRPNFDSNLNCISTQIDLNNSDSSSASSSPIALFTRAQNSSSTSSNESNSNSNQIDLFDSVKPISEPVQTTGINFNTFSYYSTSFTNSIKSKLNNLKHNLFVYKEDNDAIPIESFEAYVNKMHIDGDFGFAQLYEEITNATKTYSFTSDVSLYDCNRCKNRYSNILTYDHSRVKLSHDERDESYGYINANYVDGYQKPNAYIATQGPMPNTFADFWRMILEKNCSIIVMITNVKEKGRIKCDQYWPEDGFEFYGNIQVTHLHTITYAFYTKRIFTIKIKNSKKRSHNERLVYQFHFTDWPDHGVPYYILPVLSFIKKSSRSNPEFGGPIVVHCSAGVGRTGTYIVIDAMMKQIMHKGSVNIHTFLKHIRHQRNYLVQTEEQFIFIYDVLIESYKSGETELTEHNFKSYIKSLDCVINEEGIKFIDRQFELITEFVPKDFQISAAQMAFNSSKNRNQSIIPVNNSRVVLSRKPGIDGSEYINASYLNGCSRQDEFIVTQYPTEETKTSFWQMVWDNNSNQIVVLNSEDTENCGVYWQTTGETMKCDSFTVILREENFDLDFAIRDFLLQSIDEDYEFSCRMITANYWPDSCTPVKTSFDLINKVKMYRNQSLTSNSQSSNMLTYNANYSPIIVHDLYGGHRAGIFCALYTFQDLIQQENSVNVYEIAKMYHLKRPNIWNSQNNITLLYETVACLFEEMHLNNNYQFKNFLNLNIENHFNSYYINQLNQQQQQQQQQLQNQQSNQQTNIPNSISNPGHVSLTLLPTSQQQISSNPNTKSTVTLPNKFSQKNVSINEAIGTRLHNFQNYLQQSRVDLVDPSSIMPLNSSQIQSSKIEQTPNINMKSNFIDIQKMLPFFGSNNNEIKNSEVDKNNSSNLKENKAKKFMNTMKLKSASFKRALFQNSMMMSKQTITIEKEGDKEKESVTQILDQKPSVMISLSSDASSATTSSSSTSALSSTVINTTETYQSTNKPVVLTTTNSNGSLLNLNKAVTSTNNLPNKSTSVSKEKLT